MAGRRSGGSTQAEADLATIVTRRHDALRAETGPARAGKVAGVHQARVASRRLREVVPILGRGLEDVHRKSLRRDLRALTRALGPVRELDVARSMIEELALDSPDAGRLTTAWQDNLERKRRAPMRDLRRALGATPRRALDRELDGFAASRTTSGNDRWRQALAQRLSARAEDLRDQMVHAGTRYEPEPLHQVRIAAKKLRYVLEITGEARLAAVARPLRTLKAAQESLGRLHDFDVLLTFLRGVPGTAPGEHLQHAAANAVSVIERESRVLHGRYLRSRPALLRVAESTLADIVPKVRPAAEPGKDEGLRGH